jgi:hypothetical protein
MSQGTGKGSTSKDGTETVKAYLRLIEEHASHARQCLEEGDRESQALRNSFKVIREGTTLLISHLLKHMPEALGPLEKDE